MKRLVILGLGLAGLWLYQPYIAFWLALGVFVGWGFVPQPEWAQRLTTYLKNKLEEITGIPL